MTDNIQNGEGVELLPCPFCGDKPRIRKWHGGQPTKVMIHCQNDECYVSPQVVGDTPTIAAGRWNTRHSLAREPATADVERESPRPWRVVPYGDGDSLVIHDARGDYRVCFMATPGESPDALERIKANAALIVAAVNEYRAAPSSEPAIAEGERWTIKGVMAEMLAVATASIDEEDSPLVDEWPVDCRADVDRWQVVIRKALAATSTPPASKGVEVPDGMVRWDGGDGAPSDWNGEGVMLRNGSTIFPSRLSLAYHTNGTNRWNHKRENRNPDWDIVAYTPTPSNDTLQGRGEVERLLSEARKLRHVTIRTLECNSDDIRTADAIIRFLEQNA